MPALSIHPPRRRTWPRVALVALVIAASLAGLAPSPSAIAQEKRTVTFAFWGDPAELRAYERVVAELEAAHPSIQIEVVSTPGQGECQTRLATSFAGGNPSDVFLINDRSFGQYAARGALDPLGPYLRDSPTLTEEDFYQIPMDAFRYRGGERSCIPQSISSPVLYKGGAVSARLGVALPPVNSRVFIDTIPLIWQVPSTSTWPEIADAFNTAFKRAFFVELDIEGAIDVATFLRRNASERAREEKAARAS